MKLLRVAERKVVTLLWITKSFCQNMQIFLDLRDDRTESSAGDVRLALRMLYVNAEIAKLLDR